MLVKKVIKKLIPNILKEKWELSKRKRQFEVHYNEFLKTGNTNGDDHYQFILLYCETNGLFCENYNQRFVSENPKKKLQTPLNGVLGSVPESKFNDINSTLNEDGYVHFDKKLDAETCTRLIEFAKNTPTRIPPTYAEKVAYDPQNPKAEIYRFDIQDLANNIDIQNLIMDPTLVQIARDYLGCEPIFDFPAMWWSTAFSKEASSEAAQLYHFDLDRIKWLKIFIYLTDVTPENGPHCYIRGSHKVGVKPKELLKRGYARIKDNELAPFYPKEDFKTVYGEIGSMFAGDTKCWHKGTNLKSGNRLVLELEYTSSLFGANVPKMEIHNFSPEFKQYCAENKHFSTQFIFKN